MPSNKLLLANAQCAWLGAIKYADLLLSGEATLFNRKNFVAALHNSVELFLKQIMLDNNDYRILGNLDKYIAHDGGQLKEYLNSNNISDFIQTLDKPFTVEFGKLIEFAEKTIFQNSSSYNPAMDEAIKDCQGSFTLLQTLRNNETHFYVNRGTFLKDSEFAQLHNFMMSFRDLLREFKLLPNDTWYLNGSCALKAKLILDTDITGHFTYRGKIRATNVHKIINNAIRNGRVDANNLAIEYIRNGDVVNAAMCVWWDESESEQKFDFEDDPHRVWESLVTMYEFGVLSIENDTLKEINFGNWS